MSQLQIFATVVFYWSFASLLSVHVYLKWKTKGFDGKRLILLALFGGIFLPLAILLEYVYRPLDSLAVNIQGYYTYHTKRRSRNV